MIARRLNKDLVLAVPHGGIIELPTIALAQPTDLARCEAGPQRLKDEGE